MEEVYKNMRAERKLRLNFNYRSWNRFPEEEYLKLSFEQVEDFNKQQEWKIY